MTSGREIAMTLNEVSYSALGAEERSDVGPQGRPRNRLDA